MALAMTKLRRSSHPKSEIQQAIRQARWVTGLVQGTMSLECRGLDFTALKQLKRIGIIEFLNKS